jgi:hypothetical protein
MRRLGFGGLMVAAALVLAGQLWGLLAQAQERESSLLGRELINELGLEPDADGIVLGCDYGSEVDGSLYCLDEHVSSHREAHILAMRLRGHEPTPQDLELLDLHVLIDRLEYEAPSDPDAAARLRRSWTRWIG